MPARSARTGFACSACGSTPPRWVGRCPDCQAWDTVVAVAAPAARSGRAAPAREPASRLTEVDARAAAARPTGVGELDRVLGGGLVPGAVLLLAGEPGVGKSTLLLSVAARTAECGTRVLVVTGEESVAAVRLRAERTGAVHPEVFLAAETDLAAVLSHLDAVRPGLLVLDSVQTISAPDVDGAAGGVTQVREVAAALSAVAKARGITTVLVGHVTKDGAVAGPRLLEHLVDVVLSFEGQPHSSLRTIRASKNRYGPADEVGCFEMTDEGIREVPDPSGVFLSGTAVRAPGTAVTVTLEGRRPLLAEVQALVGPTAAQIPRRAVSGLDPGRVAMVTAILERRGGVKLSSSDVYAATVGGLRLTDPGADLALALALASAVDGRPLPSGVVVLGELGLAGEVRPVTGLDRRLAEAARMGTRLALVPPPRERAGDGGGAAAAGDPGSGMRVRPVADLGAALAEFGDLARRHGLQAIAGDPAAQPPASAPVRGQAPRGAPMHRGAAGRP